MHITILQKEQMLTFKLQVLTINTLVSYVQILVSLKILNGCKNDILIEKYTILY